MRPTSAPPKLAIYARRAHAIGSFAILVQLATTGCSTIQDRHRECSAPALDQFTRRLSRFETTPLVEIPTSIAWNALYARARQIAPLAHVDVHTLTFSTHWVYEPIDARAALNVQRRHRFQAQLSGDDRRHYKVTTAAATEERLRELCQQQPGPWTPCPPRTYALQADLTQALSGLSEVPLDQLVFPGEREALWTAVTGVLAQEWSVLPAQGEPTTWRTLTTDWTMRSYDFAETRLEVRSRVQVTIVPQRQGHSLSVLGELQHRAVETEGATGWLAAEPAPVVAHVFALLTRHVRPLTVRLQSKEPSSATDYAPPMPDLPMPRDPLVGTYHLYVRAVQVPLTKPNGLDWDVGQLVAQMLPLVRQLNLTPEPTTQLARWLTGKLADHVIGQAQAWIGRAAAPDLALVLTLRSNGTAQLIGPNDSPAAGWADPMVVQLRGHEDLGFQLWDLDLQEHDFVGQGAVPLEALANTCGPSAVYCGDAVIVFELRRVGP